MSADKQFHLPSLDGLRAVAVMIVFVSHAGWGHLVPGGFGVTIFFFLSGYLITTLLRKEYEADGAINFKHFYLRRAYRILPPMYLVLFLILLVAKLGLVEERVGLAGLAAQVLQVTNYYVLAAPEGGLVPYTGTFWSLAVEEHFYLIFPLFFLFCAGRWRAPTVAKVFLALCALELLWRCVLVFGFQATPNRTNLATDTRLDSLLFGCIMGVWMNPALDKAEPFSSSRPVKILVLAASVGLLGFTFLWRSETFRETGRYTLQSLALFPIFWLAVRHSTWPVFRILNWKPMRLLGLISYVFYLSHYFWLHLAARFSGGGMAASALLAFAATVVFSTVVYRSVELPFAALRRKLHAKPARDKTGVATI